ncbi:PREDICTED: septum-promoting GTP-binding protein 1 isoform X4 [Lupinus angustifolius]|uniref:septum-promoting GTP-binding protein 1 isoform X4 n=1 Tax=Lupinus angustifolius TaxID=3871 RepID=UPI00092F2187|nr:PREDICTED: septum-promoting GTP-binding protein 1 isoform X4 [Lupinus angustifolius]
MAKNKIIHETTRKMSQLCRKVVHVNVRWGVLQRVSFVGHFFRFIWGRLVLCSVGKPAKYRRLPFGDSSPFPAATVEERFMQEHSTVMDSGYDTDSDLVNLKISLLGDCDIGKTTFVIKYVGNEQEKKSLQMEGLNLMDKTLFVEGARISCCIWDVAGDKRSLDQIPMACKDAVAVLIMFDLTSRSTLNNVVGWYSEARKWNKARAYARAMNATLFFSSATHNINVNKIFKFIMAKLFNLPWKVERNLRVGEPIIDF